MWEVLRHHLRKALLCMKRTFLCTFEDYLPRERPAGLPPQKPKRSALLRLQADTDVAVTQPWHSHWLRWDDKNLLEKSWC